LSGESDEDPDQGRICQALDQCTHPLSDIHGNPPLADAIQSHATPFLLI
jgi:hypothetical protein